MFRKVFIIILLCSMVALGTVSTETNKTSPYTCNGSRTAFTFSFPILTANAPHTDLKVVLRTIATGNEEELVETSNYSVAAVNNDFSNGGTVTTTTAYSSSYELLIYRNTAGTQNSDLITDSGVLRLVSLEDAFDKLTLRGNDLDERLDRSIHFPISDDIDTAKLVNSIDRANTRLGFDDSGDLAVFDESGTEYIHTDYVENLITENPWIDIRAYGAIADDGESDVNAINDANNAADTGGFIFIPPGTWTLNDDVTIGNPIMHTPNSLIEGSAGTETLTYAIGSSIAAGAYQIYDYNTITVVFDKSGAVTETGNILAHWWGLKAGGDSNDSDLYTKNATAIREASVAINNSNDEMTHGTLYIPAGLYYVGKIYDEDSDSNGFVNVPIKGAGAKKTQLVLGDDVNDGMLDVSLQEVVWEDMTFHGNKSNNSYAAPLVRIRSSSYSWVFRDVIIEQSDDDGLFMDGGQNGTLENCHFWSNDGWGVELAGNLNFRIDTIDIAGNGSNTYDQYGGLLIRDWYSASARYYLFGTVRNIYWEQDSASPVAVELRSANYVTIDGMYGNGYVDLTHNSVDPNHSAAQHTQLYWPQNNVIQNIDGTVRLHSGALNNTFKDIQGGIIAAEYTITDANSTDGTITICTRNGGDISDYFDANTPFIVDGSTGNDGSYVVVSSAYSEPNLTITVASVSDDTADGTVSKEFETELNGNFIDGRIPWEAPITACGLDDANTFISNSYYLDSSFGDGGIVTSSPVNPALVCNGTTWGCSEGYSVDAVSTQNITITDPGANKWLYLYILYDSKLPWKARIYGGTTTYRYNCLTKNWGTSGTPYFTLPRTDKITLARLPIFYTDEAAQDLGNARLTMEIPQSRQEEALHVYFIQCTDSASAGMIHTHSGVAVGSGYNITDFNDTTRPDCNVPAGTQIWNNDDGFPNYSGGEGTQWYDPTGAGT